MEMIGGRRERPSTGLGRAEGWVVELRNRYQGGLERHFPPKNPPETVADVAEGIRSGCPTMARMGVAFGPMSVMALLTAHLTRAVIMLGETASMDGELTARAGQLMWMSERARPLNMMSVLRFFPLFMTGEFEIYGTLNVRKVMEAYGKYVKAAAQTEARIKDEQDERRRRIEDMGRETVTFEQWAGMRGIPEGTSAPAYFSKAGYEARDAVRIAVALSTLAAVMELIRIKTEKK